MAFRDPRELMAAAGGVLPTDPRNERFPMYEIQPRGIGVEALRGIGGAFAAVQGEKVAALQAIREAQAKARAAELEYQREVEKMQKEQALIGEREMSLQGLKGDQTAKLETKKAGFARTKQRDYLDTWLEIAKLQAANRRSVASLYAAGRENRKVVPAWVAARARVESYLNSDAAKKLPVELRNASATVSEAVMNGHLTPEQAKGFMRNVVLGTIAMKSSQLTKDKTITDANQVPQMIDDYSAIASGAIDAAVRGVEEYQTYIGSGGTQSFVPDMGSDTFMPPQNEEESEYVRSLLVEE
jgi:hypothetical protein